MKEAFVKVNLTDDDKITTISVKGCASDFIFIAATAIKFVSDATGDSIESITNKVKTAMIEIEILVATESKIKK